MEDKTYIFDSREQKNQHIIKYFENHKIPYRIEKLDVGDYQIEGHPNISVDRKQNLDELSRNLVNRKDSARFWREVRRAFDQHVKLIILCEHGKGIESLQDVMNWHSEYCKIRGQTVVERALLCNASYGVEFVFCNKRQTAKKIIELLNRC